MKILIKFFDLIKEGLCNLLNCNKITLQNNKSSFPQNDFSISYHIEDHEDYDFPQKYIYKFIRSVEDQLEAAIKSLMKKEIAVDFTAILLTIKVNSCNFKAKSGSSHELNIYGSINIYNRHLVLGNIPINLEDDKKNIDLISYLTKLIINYCVDIDTDYYGNSVDITFDYKFLKYEDYLECAEKFRKSFERSFVK